MRSSTRLTARSIVRPVTPAGILLPTRWSRSISACSAIQARTAPASTATATTIKTGASSIKAISYLPAHPGPPPSMTWLFSNRSGELAMGPPAKNRRGYLRIYGTAGPLVQRGLVDRCWPTTRATCDSWSQTKESSHVGFYHLGRSRCPQGIGDGGNEVGMGCIKETIKEILPTGANCGCPCGAGTHSDIATDLLLVAMVSNWGAYALEALLAIAKGKPEIMHDRVLEKRVFEASISAGLFNRSPSISRI